MTVIMAVMAPREGDCVNDDDDDDGKNHDNHGDNDVGGDRGDGDGGVANIIMMMNRDSLKA